MNDDNDLTSMFNAALSSGGGDDDGGSDDFLNADLVTVPQPEPEPEPAPEPEPEVEPYLAPQPEPEPEPAPEPEPVVQPETRFRPSPQTAPPRQPAPSPWTAGVPETKPELSITAPIPATPPSAGLDSSYDTAAPDTQTVRQVLRVLDAWRNLPDDNHRTVVARFVFGDANPDVGDEAEVVSKLLRIDPARIVPMRRLADLVAMPDDVTRVFALLKMSEPDVHNVGRFVSALNGTQIPPDSGQIDYVQRLLSAITDGLDSDMMDEAGAALAVLSSVR